MNQNAGESDGKSCSYLNTVGKRKRHLQYGDFIEKINVMS